MCAALKEPYSGEQRGLEKKRRGSERGKVNMKLPRNGALANKESGSNSEDRSQQESAPQELDF